MHKQLRTRRKSSYVSSNANRASSPPPTPAQPIARNRSRIVGDPLSVDIHAKSDLITNSTMSQPLSLGESENIPQVFTNIHRNSAVIVEESSFDNSAPFVYTNVNFKFGASNDEAHRDRINSISSVASNDVTFWSPVTDDAFSSATLLSPASETAAPLLLLETNNSLAEQNQPQSKYTEQRIRQIISDVPSAPIALTAVKDKICSYCSTTVTPMWRHGPVGYDVLCNGCGVKWKRGRILEGLERAPRPPTAPKQSTTAKRRSVPYNLQSVPEATAFSKSLSSSLSLSPTATATFPISHSKRRSVAFPAPPALPPNYHGSSSAAAVLRARNMSLPSLGFSNAQFGATATTRRNSETANNARIESRRDMLLRMFDGDSFSTGIRNTGSNFTTAFVSAPSAARRHSFSSVSEITKDTGLRGIFVCRALEMVEKCESLKAVAEAVRVLSRGKGGGGEEEIDLDVGELSGSEWEYLCSVLINVL
ncbi:Transcription factor [Physocladia obscura]|uniref:Transcription factor n=1 Tax=Physocladia obscura TaxID=109957 RepID=A0AAD5SVB5_9FUNG|nr:Transcription factor [Physocladia obscura]